MNQFIQNPNSETEKNQIIKRMDLWYYLGDEAYADLLDHHHPYDANIETTIYAWKILAISYCEKAEEFASDLYEQLLEIKCKKVLKNQFIRLGKTQFYNIYFIPVFRRRFQEIQRKTACRH